MHGQNLMTADFGGIGMRTPNSVVSGTGFYVSYNDVDVSDALYGCVTTALVIGQMDKFHILNGDHRAQYKTLMPQGLDVCLAYFKDNASQMNKRSDKIAA